MRKWAIAFGLILLFSLFSAPVANAEAQQPLWKCEGEGAESVYSVDISSDGSYLVAVGGLAGVVGDTIHLFNKSSSTPVWSTDIITPYTVAISEDGNYIAAGTYEQGGGFQGIYLFSRASSAPIWKYTPTSDVYSVAISSDGSYVVAGVVGIVGGPRNKNLLFFSREDNIPEWTYQCEGNTGITSVSISADGRYIAAAGGGGAFEGGIYSDKVFLFERSDNIPEWIYDSHSTTSEVAISADGNYIVVGSGDNLIVFHRSSNGPIINQKIDPHGAHTVAISQDGTYIVAGSTMSTGCDVYLFSRTSGLIWRYKTPPSESTGESNVESVGISADGSYIVIGSYYPGKVYLFGNSDNTPIWSADIGDCEFTRVAISSDGNYIVTGGAYLDESKLCLFSRSISQLSSTSLSVSPADFMLKSGQGTTLAATLTSGGSTTSSVNYTATTAGYFYIKVYRYSGSGSYSMTVTVSGGAVTTQNDMGTGGDAGMTNATAAEISAGSGTGYLSYTEPNDNNNDLHDYYKVYVGTGQTIIVSMTPPSGANFDLYLDTVLGPADSSSLTGSQTDTVEYGPLTTAGYLYIRVERASGSGTYSMTVTVTGGGAVTTQNDMGTGGDAGNSMSAATTISAGSGTGYLDSTDAADYYRVSVSAGQTISASMTPPSGSDFDIQLYDTSQSQVDYSHLGGSPLAGKTVSWSATAGSFNPQSGTTNSLGQVTTIYTAPAVSTLTDVTVTATFAYDAQYQSSSKNSSGTITAITDADNDSMDDGWETQNGLNPNANDASADPDGDGYTNFQEYQSGTDPKSASSHPGAGEVTAPSGGIPITYVGIVAVIIVVLIVTLVLLGKRRVK